MPISAYNVQPVYPPVGNFQDTLQVVRTLVPVGLATVVNVFTVAQNQGRLFLTNVIIRDPSPQAGSVGSVVLAFGSASTVTTSLTPVFSLAGLSGSTNNQFIQMQPGQMQAIGTGSIGFTTTTSYTSAVALGGGDVVQAFVTSVAGSTNATVYVDFVGYYL